MIPPPAPLFLYDRYPKRRYSIETQTDDSLDFAAPASDDLRLARRRFLSAVRRWVLTPDCWAWRVVLRDRETDTILLMAMRRPEYFVKRADAAARIQQPHP